MNNIDKIRQEIERRKKKFMFDDLPMTIGRYYEDRELLSFIDSLPEEKPSENLKEAAEEYAYRGIPDEIKQNVKPIADEIIKQFIAGAEWQANQLLKGSPLPEDTVLFQKGVEEGRRLEKDEHRLTWQDMAKIDAIILDMNNEFAVDYSKEIDRQKFYEEVLKRFREIKDEQVHQTTKE